MCLMQVLLYSFSLLCKTNIFLLWFEVPILCHCKKKKICSLMSWQWCFIHIIALWASRTWICSMQGHFLSYVLNDCINCKWMLYEIKKNFCILYRIYSIHFTGSSSYCKSHIESPLKIINPFFTILVLISYWASDTFFNHFLLSVHRVGERAHELQGILLNN